jgi:ABC-type spermidine/putrescine transport system permease subunit II
MFSGLRDSITPAMLAVATVMIVVSTLLYVGVASVQRRARASRVHRNALQDAG